MQSEPHPEKRRHKRERVSDRILWRPAGLGEYETAWMLEQSESGLAFAWRGSRRPIEGGSIDIQRSHRGHDRNPERGLVRRVRHAHDDMVIVGVEIVHLNGSGHATTTAASVVEPRPLRLLPVTPLPRAA